MITLLGLMRSRIIGRKFKTPEGTVYTLQDLFSLHNGLGAKVCYEDGRTDNIGLSPLNYLHALVEEPVHKADQSAQSRMSEADVLAAEATDGGLPDDFYEELGTKLARAVDFSQPVDGARQLPPANSDSPQPDQRDFSLG